MCVHILCSQIEKGWMEHLQVLPIEMAEKNEKLDELTSLTTTLKKENLEFKVSMLYVNC